MADDTDAIATELLLLRCLRGDAGAPGELVARFQRPLLYYLRRLMPHEADAWDVSQEAWFSVFRKLQTLQNPRAFPAFLFRTARNAALAQLRRRRIPLEESACVNVADTADSVEDEFFAREEAARLRMALEQLPLTQRDVLTLHFLQDLTLSEIAEVVGVPAGTVKSRIFHAKTALRSLLNDRRPA